MRRASVLLACALGLAAGVSSVAPAGAALAAEPAVDASDHFTQEQIDRSRRYNGRRYVLSFISLGLSLLIAGAVALGPLARSLARVATSASGGRPVVAAVLLGAMIVAAGWLVVLPISYMRLQHDRAFGLATQGFTGFMRDRIISLVFEVVLISLVAAALIWLGRRLPNGWPLAAGAGAAVLTVLLVVVFPLVYEPAFNSFTRAPDDVRRRIEAMADAAGVQIGDVLIVDASRRTTRHNAYVSGLGPTRRVVLYDTLLDGAPAAEVDLVVAHELAHVRHNDVARGTAVGVLGSLLGVATLWLVLRWAGVAAAEPRAVAIAAFVFAVGSLLTAPIANAISRRMEARADATAITLVAEQRQSLGTAVHTAVALERRLARTNIADLDPAPWMVWAFASHPTTLERIGTALERLETADAQGGSSP